MMFPIHYPFDDEAPLVYLLSKKNILASHYVNAVDWAHDRSLRLSYSMIKDAWLLSLLLGFVAE